MSLYTKTTKQQNRGNKMNDYEFTLTQQDIDTIYDALCESVDENNVTNSVLADVFMILSKLNTPVALTPDKDVDNVECCCETNGLSDRISCIIDDIGDALDEFDKDEFDDEFVDVEKEDNIWSTCKVNEDDIWNTNIRV